MTLLSLLLPVALAADPPSINTPVKTGLVNKKDAAVVIGIEDYDHLNDVPFALADSAAVYSWFQDTRGIYKRNLFSADNPDDDELRSTISRAIARVQKGGTLWIYYVGQGGVADGKARLPGADLTPDQMANALSIAELEAMAARSRAAKVVLVVDASFDGLGRANTDWDQVSVPELKVREGNSKVAVWVASETGTAYNYAPTGHGLFTYLWLGSMRGWADGADGTVPNKEVTLGEAQTYISRQMVAYGRVQLTTVDKRADVQKWPVSIGPLEAGPSPADVAAWSLADRDARMAAAQQHLFAEAQKALDDAVAKSRAGDPKGAALVQEVIDQYEHTPVTITWIVPNPAVAKGRELLLDPDALKPVQKMEQSTTTSTTTTPDAVVRTDTGDTGAPQLSDDTCADVVAMEPDALLGIFSPGRIACIEERIANPKEPQTSKDKLSRLLMADADAKGDTEAWERLLKRHLTDISRADPDLCFVYALALSKKGIEYGEEVIRWADYALENKQKWTGDIYKKRLYDLYRLKSEAAGELWRDAEQNLIADPTDENDAKTNMYRGKAKNYAREWLDYARASGQKTDRALALCLSAAGTMAACSDD